MNKPISVSNLKKNYTTINQSISHFNHVRIEFILRADAFFHKRLTPIHCNKGKPK